MRVGQLSTSMARVCFEEMSDDRVLQDVEGLVRRSNETTAVLLAYLAEVDERKLYRREATSSLFAFCVERLHMSEGAAAKRIWAARAGRRFPLVLEMIARGEIHLTGVNLLAAHLTDDNHAELLARARHRTRREIERLLAELAPRPDVSSRIAALAPLAPRRYELRVTIGEETHARLVQLQDLLAPGADLAAIVSRAVDELHERTLARKAAITDKPRASKSPEKRSRSIPAAVRRGVWTRDGARCAFVDDKGRRCSATRFLQFHHLDNWARGAEHSIDRIELRCHAHNQYQADLDYGADFMRARREGCSSAREPARAYHAATEHSPGNAMARAYPLGFWSEVVSGEKKLSFLTYSSMAKANLYDGAARWLQSVRSQKRQVIPVGTTARSPSGGGRSSA